MQTLGVIRTTTGGWVGPNGEGHRLVTGGRLPRLTTAEKTILELVAAGLCTGDIALELHVSRQAVAYHLGNLFRKVEVENRAGLVSKAYVLGYLSPDAWPPSCCTN